MAWPHTVASQREGHIEPLAPLPHKAISCGRRQRYTTMHPFDPTARKHRPKSSQVCVAGRAARVGDPRHTGQCMRAVSAAPRVVALTQNPPNTCADMSWPRNGSTPHLVELLPEVNTNTCNCGTAHSQQLRRRAGNAGKCVLTLNVCTANRARCRNAAWPACSPSYAHCIRTP